MQPEHMRARDRVDTNVQLSLSRWSWWVWCLVVEMGRGMQPRPMLTSVLLVSQGSLAGNL